MWTWQGEGKKSHCYTSLILLPNKGGKTWLEENMEKQIPARGGGGLCSLSVMSIGNNNKNPSVNRVKISRKYIGMVQLGKDIKGCRKRKNNIHGQRIETSVKFTALRYCCCCSVPKLGLVLCDPMDCSPPDSSILLYSPDFAQIHVH